MENDDVEKKSITPPEARMVLIGERWAGKSLSGNTILRDARFKCGRTRTAESEVRYVVVEGRKVTVVDTSGWSNVLSVAEISEGDKQRFKLTVSKCPPGPHVFLLTVPIDTAFTVDHRRIVEAHMRLLGNHVWKYTMVLFTCGDFLGEKTIEQHIESEGDALRWLVERCGNRYHVFNNKDQSNSAQVKELLERIDHMVQKNHNAHYEIDEQTLNMIRERQQAVAERAERRRKMAEEQTRQMKSVISEMQPIHNLRVILLGSRGVGKTSLGNLLLRIKARGNRGRTTQSVAQQGRLGKTEVTVVDTPGWWKSFSAFDTPEAIKDELRRSVFMCPPGPHVLLVVLDTDASFNADHLDAVTTHVELLGRGVWRHAVAVFTRGDWLGTSSIERFIEWEGEALQYLIDSCGNRYHVIDNRNTDDDAQITELLEKIIGTVAGNGSECLIPDQQVFQNIEERRKQVEEGATKRRNTVKTMRQSFRGSRSRLQELQILMLGQKRNGKSATGNNLLQKEAFATGESKHCQEHEAQVAKRLIRLTDTPGWCKEAPKELDKEIVRGLLLSPSGVHAVLLVIPLDLTFREAQQKTLEEYMDLFDSSIWKHTIVLFTYGDNLVDKSVEEHIEREHQALRWLVDKCGNRYHVMNNMKTNDMSQVTELFEKIDEMVAGNSGQLFCPDVFEVYLRLEEKFKKSQLKHVLKSRMKTEFLRRELKLKRSFKETLLELQAYVKDNRTGSKSQSFIANFVPKKNQEEKEENLILKISWEIKKLDDEMRRTRELLGGSMDFLIPDLSGEDSAQSGSSQPDSEFDKVLSWLSQLHMEKNVENQLTLNFSQTSGYRSELSEQEEDRRGGSRVKALFQTP